MLEKLFAAANAVKAGESLKNPEAWKSVQSLMPPILVILGVIPQFLDITFTDQQANAIAFGIATAGVLFNTYLTRATTTKPVPLLPKFGSGGKPK